LPRFCQSATHPCKRISLGSSLKTPVLLCESNTALHKTANFGRFYNFSGGTGTWNKKLR
jgi:hypothetical protein